MILLQVQNTTGCILVMDRNCYNSITAHYILHNTRATHHGVFEEVLSLLGHVLADKQFA